MTSTTSPSLAPSQHVDLPALAARTAALLAGHVPLTLLLDLAGPPASEALYRAEEPDLTWLRG